MNSATAAMTMQTELDLGRQHPAEHLALAQLAKPESARQRLRDNVCQNQWDSEHDDHHRGASARAKNERPPVRCRPVRDGLDGEAESARHGQRLRRPRGPRSSHREQQRDR